MKLVKSLLLGSAAGLVAVASAQAADLPSRKAAPVEYVKVCSAFGAGFFYIPGTDTCLRISGRVRAEYRYLEPRWTVPGNGRNATPNGSSTGVRARGRLNIDARTQTAYGTLRTFIRMEATTNKGNYGFAAPGINLGTFDLNKAFIQFAGMTAGKTTSFFDFYANDLNWGRLAGSDTYGNDPVVLAYTATFGSGFSATLSLEDNAARRVDPFGIYGGHRMPDIVASLRVDQGWGSAQLSGIVHQIFTNNAVFNAGIDTEYGYAIQGGVKFNLPMLAAGDALWLQAAYAEGVLSALGGNAAGIGPIAVVGADASVVAIAPGVNALKKSSGWAITGAFLHYWTPTLRQAVFGSYMNVDYANITGINDWKEWRVGTNLTWSPVRGLDIGVEVLYANLDPRGNVAVVPALGLFKGNESIWEARFRVQRDF
jgi:hypothetical protein